MEKELLEIMKKAAPATTLKKLEEILPKEYYKDGDIVEIIDNSTKHHSNRIRSDKEKKQSKEERLKYLTRFSKYYKFGKKDLEALEKAKKEVQEIVSKEEAEEKQNEEKERKMYKEEYKIIKAIKKKNKEEIKEEMKMKNELDIVKYMFVDGTCSHIILESAFELFEEGVINSIPLEAITMMKHSEKNRRHLEEMLGKRNEEFNSLRNTMKEMKRFFYLINYEKELYEEEGTIIDGAAFFREKFFSNIIERIMPAISQYLESEEEEGREKQEEYLSDKKAVDELYKKEIAEIEEKLYIYRPKQKEKTVDQLLEFLIQCLSENSKNYNQAYPDFKEEENAKEVFNCIKSLKENIYKIEHLMKDKEGIIELLNYILLFDGEKNCYSDTEREQMFIKSVKNNVTKTRREFEDFMEVLTNGNKEKINKEALKKIDEKNVERGREVIMEYFFKEVKQELEEKGIEMHWLEEIELVKELIDSKYF